MTEDSPDKFIIIPRTHPHAIAMRNSLFLLILSTSDPKSTAEMPMIP